MNEVVDAITRIFIESYRFSTVDFLKKYDCYVLRMRNNDSQHIANIFFMDSKIAVSYTVSGRYWLDCKLFKDFYDYENTDELFHDFQVSNYGID